MSGDRPMISEPFARKLAKIAAFLPGILAGTLATNAQGATSTIGRTWPIAEPDALAEIEHKASALPPDLGQKFGPRSTWTAMHSAQLATASVSKVRSLVPFHTLDMDITLPDGRVLYPRGFTFNPLTYVTLPQKLVIVHPRDLAWALRTAAPTDWILLASGADDVAAGNGDPMRLAETARRPLFILEERVKDRLALTVAPVVVRQVGKSLELTEIALKRGPAT